MDIKVKKADRLIIKAGLEKIKEINRYQEIKWNPCIYVRIGVKQKEHE